MTNTVLLENLIMASGLKKKFIAEKLGICRQQLNKKIAGLVPFTGPEIKNLCKLLNLDEWGVIKPVFFADDVIKSANKAG